MIEKFLKKMSPCNDIKEALEASQKEVVELKKQLQSRQDVINKTNAYWKKKLYEIKRSGPRSSSTKV